MQQRFCEPQPRTDRAKMKERERERKEGKKQALTGVGENGLKSRLLKIRTKPNLAMTTPPYSNNVKINILFKNSDWSLVT